MYKMYLRPWIIAITNPFSCNIPQGSQHRMIATETGNSWSFSVSLSSFLCFWEKHSMICFLWLSQVQMPFTLQQVYLFNWQSTVRLWQKYPMIPHLPKWHHTVLIVLALLWIFVLLLQYYVNYSASFV